MKVELKYFSGTGNSYKILEKCEEAQNSPCAFGTFCIVFNGKIIAEHPISNGRFTNIMNKINK
jgi:hypothetical protein